MSKSADSKLSRRQILRSGLTAAAATVLASDIELAFPSQAIAQSQLTPEAALSQLMEGNKRFTVGGLMAHDQDLAILKQHTEEKQEPFAARCLLRCR
jgi:carbonic anhydrase